MALSWLNDMPILSGIHDLAAGKKNIDWSGKHIEGRNVARQGANAISTGFGLLRPMADYDLSKTFTISDRVGQRDVLPGGTRKFGEVVQAPNYSTAGTSVGGGGTNSGVYGTSMAVDPAYQALLQQQAQQRAQEAADTAEAQRIRDAILGRRQSVEDMLATILGNIDSQLREGKGSREASFNRDVADLVSSLDGSIPDIENAFSALGLSNSTYKADRVQDTRDAYERSYVDTERQKAEDLAAMQQKATGEKSKWRGEANNILDTIGTFQDMQPTHNDLNRLKDADLGSKKSINSFRSSRDAFQPGSDALSAITKLDGDYDFSKTLDSFNSLASASNPASGAVGAGTGKGAGGLFEDDKKNKKKTEVQVNNPVGAASA